MIKRIELINFMSHRHTVIELDAGLTVLVGPNNCGKSAVVTALQILCHNDNSTYVMRHGAKECRVVVETSEGHRIEWIRKKSGSASYLVNGEEFDRLKNASGVWEQLRQTLRMPRLEFSNGSKFDVHIGEQRNPIFLLGDKGKGAAQFFASSSDAIRLVEMQALHKKQVAENKSERKFLLKDQAEIDRGLELLSQVPAMEARLEELEMEHQSLQEEQLKVQRLAESVTALRRVSAERARLLAISAALCELPAPPEFEDGKALQGLTRQIVSTQSQIRQSQSQHAALEKLAPPPSFADESSLSQLCENIRAQRNEIDRHAGQLQVLSRITDPPQMSDQESVAALARFLVRYQTKIQELAEIDKQRIESERSLARVDQEIKTWASENPNCPTCGSLVSAEELIAGPAHRHGVDSDA